jgi:hypothetical protein
MNASSPIFEIADKFCAGAGQPAFSHTNADELPEMFTCVLGAPPRRQKHYPCLSQNNRRTVSFPEGKKTLCHLPETCPAHKPTSGLVSTSPKTPQFAKYKQK